MSLQGIAFPELFFTHATTEGGPDHVLDWLEPRPPGPGPHSPLDLQQALGHLAHAGSVTRGLMGSVASSHLSQRGVFCQFIHVSFMFEGNSIHSTQET